jgi:tRNA(adenine34) deaminase
MINFATKSINKRMKVDIEQDEFWMRHALSLAAKAEQQNEIPVGAVLVKDQQIIGEGWNQSISLHDPSAHAEMMAIRAAGQAIENYRLVNSSLYVTLEPCAMCAGLLIHSRIQRLIFGAADLKTGAVGSVYDLLSDKRVNHQIEVSGGVLADECGQKLSGFFKQRRSQKKELKKLSKLANT